MMYRFKVCPLNLLPEQRNRDTKAFRLAANETIRSGFNVVSGIRIRGTYVAVAVPLGASAKR